jgi:hypothetical protein
VVSGLCPVGYDAAVLQALADSRMLLGTCVLLDFCEVFEDHAVSRFAKPGAKLERDPWMIPGGFAWHPRRPRAGARSRCRWSGSRSCGASRRTGR